MSKQRRTSSIGAWWRRNFGRQGPSLVRRIGDMFTWWGMGALAVIVGGLGRPTAIAMLLVGLAIRITGIVMEERNA